MKIKRIAIMTGGGDCPGLNPVIRAVVKTGIGRHGWKILGIEDAFNGLIDLNYRSPYGNRWLDEDSVNETGDGSRNLGFSSREARSARKAGSPCNPRHRESENRPPGRPLGHRATIAR